MPAGFLRKKRWRHHRRRTSWKGRQVKTAELSWLEQNTLWRGEFNGTNLSTVELIVLEISQLLFYASVLMSLLRDPDIPSLLGYTFNLARVRVVRHLLSIMFMLKVYWFSDITSTGTLTRKQGISQNATLSKCAQRKRRLFKDGDV